MSMRNFSITMSVTGLDIYIDQVFIFGLKTLKFCFNKKAILEVALDYCS